ncbi:hypothetical protein [Acinetobacter baumannii]|uniref:hypothetical protein n=1 Tax=Acinetobacter baumannii TaxID=470 RepID=UPI0008DD73F4|nr:hypothetical protein [Acinetobacter baumannii]OIB66654.1 hypothetical protein A7L34_12470 [Acinetobacter baumannii]OIE94426.1 hypothetical protein A7L81_02870 [Acinetobacter baumannii]OIF15454.1 hypothetical protein A7L98_09335 [Acinetobacter baumannii]UQY25455.1 hypothetical protein KU039_19115 [Acinetobacter baumannii]
MLKLKDFYQIVLYDQRANRDIILGRIDDKQYKKYLPTAIKNSISQKAFWLFLLKRLKSLMPRFLLSFLIYLIVSISFVFSVSELKITTDNLLQIINYPAYLFITFLYLITSSFYFLIQTIRKSTLYIDREVTRLFFINSIFNKTDYDYSNIYLERVLKFK